MQLPAIQINQRVSGKKVVAGVHKGAALAKVGALLGIPTDSMMAFGDTYNDAEMLTTAKYGFPVSYTHLDVYKRQRRH